MIVLISSLSKKISIVKALRKLPFNCFIVGGDCDPHCIGRYFVDEFWQMPPLKELTLESFIAGCKLRGITHVIPTRDGELNFYATHKKALLQQGIHVMVSSLEVIKTCLDKLAFYETMKALGYLVIETSADINDLTCAPYVVKEQFGSASVNVGLNLTKNEAIAYAKKLKNPIFQPVILGAEISADIYVKKGAILRTRELVVNGESQISTTFGNEVLENLCLNMAQDLKLEGHIMFQFIGAHLLECNPRFGGASALSLQVGLDSFYWFLSGEDRPFKRAKTECKLVRYPEDLFLL